MLSLFEKAPINGRLSSSEDRLILCYSFFKISRYRLRSEKMCDDRLLLLNNFLATKPKTSRIFGRALMGFFSVQIFR